MFGSPKDLEVILLRGSEMVLEGFGELTGLESMEKVGP